MKRSRSSLAQFVFDARNSIQALLRSRYFAARIASRAANKFVIRPLLKSAAAKHVVSARLYNHDMVIPVEHPLPEILAYFPQYNRPLGLLAEVIASEAAAGSPLALVDVGANIGETVAIVELHCPGRFSYLCVEPDEEIAELCKYNHTGNPRVEVEQCFIGEDEGATVHLLDDGRANPSTILVKETNSKESSSGSGKLFRLDTVGRSFADRNSRLDLLKVDTEGYDFSVLRSARNILTSYKPAVYFEWYPDLLTGLGETVWGGFEYLAELGYRHFVFFTSTGDYYCKVSDPDNLLLRSLAAAATGNRSLSYFDVVASTDMSQRDTLVERCIESMATGANNGGADTSHP
jgi:FkbM family methyltransferase